MEKKEITRLHINSITMKKLFKTDIVLTIMALMLSVGINVNAQEQSMAAMQSGITNANLAQIPISQTSAVPKGQSIAATLIKPITVDKVCCESFGYGSKTYELTSRANCSVSEGFWGVGRQIVDYSKCVKDEPVPTCTIEYAPVCGMDGKTYFNTCMAEKGAKVEIKHKGECHDEEVELLFVFNAEDGTIEKSSAYDHSEKSLKLTLSGHTPHVLAFSDRPFREAEEIAMYNFLRLWEDGKTFATDPPNATFSFQDASDPDPKTSYNVIAEITSATLDPDTSDIVFELDVINTVNNDKLAIWDGHILGTKVPTDVKEVNVYIDGLVHWLETELDTNCQKSSSESSLGIDTEIQTLTSSDIQNYLTKDTEGCLLTNYNDQIAKAQSLYSKYSSLVGKVNKLTSGDATASDVTECFSVSSAVWKTATQGVKIYNNIIKITNELENINVKHNPVPWEVKRLNQYVSSGFTDSENYSSCENLQSDEEELEEWNDDGDCDDCEDYGDAEDDVEDAGSILEDIFDFLFAFF